MDCGCLHSPKAMRLRVNGLCRVENGSDATRCGEDRNHAAIEIAPGGLSVQAKKNALRIGRDFVEPVDAHPVVTVEIVDAVAGKRVAGQIGKARFRGAQCPGHEPPGRPKGEFTAVRSTEVG